MSFDWQQLWETVAARGPVVRVLVLATAGSAPREAGTSMLVWQAGQSGTIGGGALEWEATKAARAILAAGVTGEPGAQDRVERQPLGPALAQCCGGAVTLLTEVWDEPRLRRFEGQALVQRPTPEALSIIPSTAPLSARRAQTQHRNGTLPDAPLWQDGWITEVARPSRRPLWIYGAGHVGRALVSVLAPLPDFAITWVDTGIERFPDIAPNTRPDSITILPAVNPADAARLAPPEAEHLVLTYSHPLDLEICHCLLNGAFAFVGLIGSETKWARFQSRLRALGHSDAQISRITCPIGDPKLGKHPQAIAVGVASGLLSTHMMKKAAYQPPTIGAAQ